MGHRRSGKPLRRREQRRKERKCQGVKGKGRVKERLVSRLTEGKNPQVFLKFPTANSVSVLYRQPQLISQLLKLLATPSSLRYLPPPPKLFLPPPYLGRILRYLLSPAVLPAFQIILSRPRTAALVLLAVLSPVKLPSELTTRIRWVLPNEPLRGTPSTPRVTTFQVKNRHRVLSPLLLLRLLKSSN